MDDAALPAAGLLRVFEFKLQDLVVWGLGSLGNDNISAITTRQFASKVCLITVCCLSWACAPKEM